MPAKPKRKVSPLKSLKRLPAQQPLVKQLVVDDSSFFKIGDIIAINSRFYRVECVQMLITVSPFEPNTKSNKKPRRASNDARGIVSTEGLIQLSDSPNRRYRMV
jgi:hypothetical protein